MRGKRVCYHHGGKSPGAPQGERHGNYKHGRRTKRAQEFNLFVRELLRDARETRTAG